MVTIVSKREGFRRCGVAHTKEPVEYPDDHWTGKQLKALKAEPMLVVNVQKGKAPKAPSQGAGTGKGGNEAPVTQAEIIEAIGKLDKENKDLWTSDEKPQVSALEEVLGKNISAADRNAAWAEINKDND